MSGKNYNTKSLIEAYVNSQRLIDSSKGTYYAGLVKNLEALFQVELARNAFDERDRQHFERHRPRGNRRNSWQKFEYTVKNYLDLLLAHQLYFWAEGDWFCDPKVSLARKKIVQATEALKQGYSEMLCVIFEQVYGQIDIVVSSADLEKLGFNDSSEPDFYADLDASLD